MKLGVKRGFLHKFSAGLVTRMLLDVESRIGKRVLSSFWELVPGPGM